MTGLAPHARRLLAAAALPALATMGSCGRDAPGAPRAEGFALPAVHPRFPAAFGAPGLRVSTLVPFSRVRLHLTRADSSIAFDSTYEFASALDSLSLNVQVKLGVAAPRAGEPMQLSLAYINADRDTVFRGGPATVIAQPIGVDLPAPAPVEVPVRYAGAGANATRVFLNPRAMEVTSGDVFTFAARTVDATGKDVTGAPVLYSSLDTLLAPLSRYTSGAGLARGTAGTVRIVATMFNGATDTAQLVILRRAVRLRIVSGGGQSAVAGSSLPQPVVVRVVDVEEQGVPGVGVSFAPSSGGHLTNVAQSTDGDGYARATWRLAQSVGTQTLTVASGSLLGSPFSVSATATTPADTTRGGGNAGGSGGDLNKATLSIVSGNGQAARVGTALADPLVVQLLDATGAPLPNVEIAWKPGSGDGVPGDTVTRTDAKGLSSNKWVLGGRDGGMKLKASLVKANGVSAEFSATALSVTAAPPGKLVFSTGPSDVTVGVVMRPAVVVEAFDARGKHDSTFAGKVSLALVSPTGSTRLTGNTTVVAVVGLAVFDQLQFDTPESGLSLIASADGVTSATSTTFSVSNPPARLSEVSGGSQEAKPGAALAKPLVVLVEDARGKAMAGVTVTWVVEKGGGRITASSVTANNGRASATWTLGPSTGTQTAQAIVASASGSPITFTATAR
ncbi:MAG: Ig-like domain-containing protein [Gemmatimonadetes bacterium]|nr:Ig-like domain-containing protein [Gemmatimonadota bacterium]